MLDTHVVIWATASPERLDARVRDAILALENEVFISSATIWEISIKIAAGKLTFPVEQYEAIARRLGAAILPITPAHAVMAGALPRRHGDPFDRMLIAQAMCEHLVLVTGDPVMMQYDVVIFGK